MIVKSPILPKRVRKVPKGFSWIDHRLVSDRHIDRCSHEAGALYLFLVCVGDDKGLSYYGDRSITQKLSMDQKTLQTARSDLIRNALIAWQKPIYQVLCLTPAHESRRSGSAMSLGDILKNAVGGET
ncbi:MAG: hypothetical protein JRF40_12625 [Deltaproteobacteria bacterium]|nr:hypothetical protein [Deltaproteobacteria bacterium]